MRRHHRPCASLLIAAGAASAAEINVMLTDALGTSFDEIAPPFARANGHDHPRAARPVRRAGAAASTAANSPTSSWSTTTSIDELIAEGKAATGPHRPHPHRHRHRRPQGRAASRRLDAGGVQARAARRQDDRPHRSQRRRPHRRADHGGVREARHRRTGRPEIRLAAGGPNGRVSTLVATGEAEIGMQKVSELMSNPELEVIGMLPAELQLITVYSAASPPTRRSPTPRRR